MSPRRVLASLGVLLATAMTGACYDPRLAECRIICAADSPCPQGWACASGFCTQHENSPPACASPPAVADAAIGPSGDAAADTGLGDRPASVDSGIPEAVLSLSASSLGDLQVGAPVLRWADESDRGRLAGVTAAPTDSTQPPTVQVVDGKRVVQFAGERSILTLGDQRQWSFGFADFLVAVVAALPRDTEAPGICLYSKYTSRTGFRMRANQLVAGDPGHAGLDLAGAVALRSDRVGYDDGKLHLFIGRRSGGRVELRVDGLVVGSIAADPSTVDAAAPLLLGSCDPILNNGTPAIAEVRAYLGANDDAGVADLEASLGFGVSRR